MRFQISLSAIEGKTLPLNYAYPLSAAIYKIIQTADVDYAAFLHNAGYGNGLKRFKLFTFSELRTPFRIQGDRMIMLTNEASLQICFYLPQAAETFIKGLFLDRVLEIADRMSRVSFTVSGIESRYEFLPQADSEGMVHICVKPLSPMVVGRKNERGNYDYLSPLEAEFPQWLVYNLVEKWGSIHETDEEAKEPLRRKIEVSVVSGNKPPQQRVIAIKAGTPEETKVKGFMKFALKMRMPAELAQLALGAGCGLYNAVGMGCVFKVDCKP